MKQRGAAALVKRAVDVAASVAALAALSPVICATALAVRVRMGAPVFFRQTRPGYKGRPFELIKLRTMRTPKPGEGPDTDGARLTPLGRFLRSTSLDELPTLWNTLRGDMSLVGPRPLLLEYLDRYTPEQARRHDVMPGVTGWAQVNGRNALSWEAKFEHDVWYVDNWSLALDAKILLKTVAQVLRRDGISHEGSSTMPVFTATSEPSALRLRG